MKKWKLEKDPSDSHSVAWASAVDPSALGRALPRLPGPVDGHLRRDLLVIAALPSGDGSLRLRRGLRDVGRLLRVVVREEVLVDGAMWRLRT